MIKDATFIHSDPGHAQADEYRKNEAKTRRKGERPWIKKGKKPHFGY
jgi:transposase, IS5 family